MARFASLTVNKTRHELVRLRQILCASDFVFLLSGGRAPSTTEALRLANGRFGSKVAIAVPECCRAALVPAPRPRAFCVGFDARRSPLTHERRVTDAF